MSSNRVCLNTQKTQFIWMGTRQQLGKLNLDTLSAELPTMSFSSVVRDPGVLLDSELTLSLHIDQVCHSFSSSSEANPVTEHCCFCVPPLTVSILCPSPGRVRTKVQREQV